MRRKGTAVGRTDGGRRDAARSAREPRRPLRLARAGLQTAKVRELCVCVCAFVRALYGFN